MLSCPFSGCQLRINPKDKTNLGKSPRWSDSAPKGEPSLIKMVCRTNPKLSIGHPQDGTSFMLFHLVSAGRLHSLFSVDTLQVKRIGFSQDLRRGTLGDSIIIFKRLTSL